MHASADVNEWYEEWKTWSDFKLKWITDGREVEPSTSLHLWPYWLWLFKAVMHSQDMRLWLWTGRTHRGRHPLWWLQPSAPLFTTAWGSMLSPCRWPVLRWLATDWPRRRCIYTKTQATFQKITRVWRRYTQRHLHADLCFSDIRGQQK